MGRVVVDTSAWISFLRRPGSAMGDEVTQLIREGDAVLVGPAAAELFAGTRSAREADDLHVLIDYVGIAETTPSDWVRAGSAALRLRRRGITLPPYDALIAAIARRLGLPVLTHDKHFEHFEIPLEYRPLVTSPDR